MKQLAVLMLLAALGLGIANANPYPSAGLMIHVQEVDPTFCETNPMTSCADLVLATDQSGLLEFDLFVQRDLSDPLDVVSCTLGWTAGWTFQSVEFCAGVGVFELAGDGIDLLVNTPSVTDPFFLLARVVIDVTSYGRIRGDGWIHYEAGWEEYLYNSPTDAGRTCGTCLADCNYDDECKPIVDPYNLYFEVAQGETAQGQFDLLVSSFTGWPCALTAEADAPWLALTLEEVSYEVYIGHVTVDATGLSVGEYTSWIRCWTEVCERCVEVHLAVDEATPTVPASWGMIKTLYR